MNHLQEKKDSKRRLAMPCRQHSRKRGTNHRGICNQDIPRRSEHQQILFGLVSTLETSRFGISSDARYLVVLRILSTYIRWEYSVVRVLTNQTMRISCPLTLSLFLYQRPRNSTRMTTPFPEIRPNGSLLLAWQIRDKHVLLIGGGEVGECLTLTHPPLH